MRQNPDTYNIIEIQCMHSSDSARLFVDRIEYDQLRAENAKLRRVIKEVAIPALTECDEAMDYMSEYDIPLMLPDHVKTGLATLQEAVK